MNKLQVYHFHNGSGGGVFSVIKNLIAFSVDNTTESHIIHAVNIEQIPSYKIEPVANASSQQLFYYTGKNNFYHTCRELAKFLPDEKAVIVAHDWLELGMASNLGLQNPVVQVLHGDFEYYYDLAATCRETTDAFVCISPVIFNALQQRLPGEKEKIVKLNFPVAPSSIKKEQNEFLHIIYFVRDLTDERKQFSTVVKISQDLALSGTKCHFTIAGGGMSRETFFKKWPEELHHEVTFLGQQTNEEILSVLPMQDLFLLPSLAEGLPVSLVEAMKCGLVPLVTNWKGAADELITPGITGYYFEAGAVNKYVSCINRLNSERSLLNNMSDKCRERANEIFDPKENTQKWEALFRKVLENRKGKKRRIKKFGSRLDQPWLGNILTFMIRNNLKLNIHA